MRVFVLCSTDWIYTLPLGFKEAGYEIKKSGPIFEDKLIKQIDEFKPDLVMSMGWTEDQSVERQLLAKKVIKAAGIPHVYWSVEDPNYTSNFSLPLIERVDPDFVFSICEETVDIFRKQGIKAGYLDFGYSNFVHYPISTNEKKEYSIIVVANAYVDILKNYPNHFRYESYKTLITPLLEAGIKIHFWGSEWENAKDVLGVDISKEYIHGYIPYLNTNKLYNSADIIIGLQNYKNMVTQRTYEILASGGFLLTANTSAINELFNIGKNLVASSSPEETVKLVKHYLNNPVEREKIAMQGRTALSGHSYKDRAQYMVDVLYKEGIIKKV